MTAQGTHGDNPAGTAASDRPALLICAAYVALTFAWYWVWKSAMAERSADEAIFENCLWNFWNGNGLRSWLEGGPHHLAVHFSPVIYVFVPLYKLFPSMHVVHLVVSILTAAAGWFLFRFCRETLSPAISTIVMAAFLLNPTVVLQTFMEFHEQALGFLPLILVLYWHRKGSVWKTFAAAVALLAVREDNALLLILLAVYSLWARRSPRLILMLVGSAIAWLLLYWQVGVQGLGRGALPGVFASTYGQWGSTPAEVVRAVVTEPERVARHLLSRAPVKYLVQLLAPLLGVLPFGHPLVLIMTPQLLMILLADPQTRMYELRMHYSIVPVVMLYIGAIGTLTWLESRKVGLGRGRRRIGAALVLASGMLLASAATVPIWFARGLERLNPYVSEIRTVLAVVPDTASVRAPGYLLNQLAQRRRLAFAWDENVTGTEYVILEDADKKFFSGTSIDIPYSPRLAEILERDNYEQILDRNGWHVWRKRAEPPAKPAAE